MAEASRQIDSVWYGAHSGKWYHMFTLQCSAGEPRFENECCIHLSFGQFHLDPSLQWTIMAFFAPIQFYQSLGRRLFKTFKVFFLHEIKILEVFMFSPVYVSSLFCLTWAQRNAGECLVEREERRQNIYTITLGCQPTCTLPGQKISIHSMMLSR